jgi:hypothetical protein
MQKHIIDEKTGIRYTLVGDYYMPDLKAPEPPVVGKYGRMYLRYLKEQRRGYYAALLMSGRLKQDVEEVDRRASEMMERLVHDMASRQGITERLKAEDQMLWVGRINNIRSSAEEIVLQDVVYT